MLGFAGKLRGLDVLSSLDLGETNGQVTTLANPNLTALSGETATFLAGGEIPIPLSQGRSEEHTSELQSLMRISYAVFRLKKKNSARRKHSSDCQNKHTETTYNINIV